MSSELILDVDAHFAFCCEQVAAGQTEETLAALHDGEQRFPDDVRFPASRARLLLTLGHLADAVPPARTALTLDPDCATALYVLGYALFLEGQPDESLIHLHRLVTLEPTYPDALWLYAAVQSRLYGERDKRVLAAYDTALASDPNNAYAQVERAGIYRTLGRYEEARAVYERFAQSEHCDDDFLRLDCRFQLGCVCMVLGENEKAREAFQAVIDVAPDYPDAQMMRAMTAK